MIDIKNILCKKFKNGTLGHLYILKTALEYDEAGHFLTEWVNEFIERSLSRPISSLQNHPDILYISSDEENTYKISDDNIKSFFKFVSFRPFELAHRFIIIENAHLISDIVANKFLISFESPPENVTIFILDPLGKKLLPTIQSRAITINIGIDTEIDLNSSQEIGFLEYFKQEIDSFKQAPSSFKEYIQGPSITLSGLVSALKAKKQLTIKCILIALDYERLHGKDFLKKEKLLQDIQWLKESSIYSNSNTQIIASIFKDHFLQ